MFNTNAHDSIVSKWKLASQTDSSEPIPSKSHKDECNIFISSLTPEEKEYVITHNGYLVTNDILLMIKDSFNAYINNILLPTDI